MIEPALDVPLAPLTTLRLGGPARRLVTVTTEEDLVEVVQEGDAAGEPLLVLAGGSNVVIADAGWDGTVVRVATSGVKLRDVGERVEVRAAAGENWDALVERLVAGGLAGVECLAGIPGSTGATPIQNVGAYGQEVASALKSVRVLDRVSGLISELSPAACGLRYRSSIFKRSERHLVLTVTFELARSDLSEPIAYAELARTLEVDPGERVPHGIAGGAELELRRSKGMVLDSTDHDTWSAGSFFTNPILEPAGFEEMEARVRGLVGGEARPPRFPQQGGRIKTSAAWLIERAGFGRGDRRGEVSLSGKHSLALTNRGAGTSDQLIDFAREIAQTVYSVSGVALQPEPALVGIEWDGPQEVPTPG